MESEKEKKNLCQKRKSERKRRIYAKKESQKGKEESMLKIIGRIRSILKRKKYKKRYIKAVFTVEASLIVPLILFTTAGGINIGFKMFKQAENAAQIQEELEKLNPAEVVRRNRIIQEAVKSRADV